MEQYCNGGWSKVEKSLHTLLKDFMADNRQAMGDWRPGARLNGHHQMPKVSGTKLEPRGQLQPAAAA